MKGVNKIVNEVGEVIDKVPEIYEDGLKPVTQETGKTLAIIPKAINAALAPLRQWIAQKEYNVAETERLLQKKLEAINANDIVTPEAYVAVPAIQAISYSMDSAELRDLYANLIAASMVKETKWSVHPSFVEIIKQLSPDEAKLLKKISEKDRYPLIDVRIRYPDGSYVVVIRNFSLIAENICENPTEIYSYLDNLQRLKIIDIYDGVYIKDDEAYYYLENYMEIKEIMKKSLPDDCTWEIKRKKFQLTEYGKNFIDLCVPNK